ncbi:MAG: hypothetical protein Edafosvirus3_31 [Edafosvirus sp.]|uniref:Uncharacterized protein n=1 Tax=Edafosvirus sp. TaxID=2487765 RepID=A0A3G4ZWH8_9VIRU|nr:MAG: hypothetical protein Edafosvirus3_31 [Edafosvirus sp.]
MATLKVEKKFNPEDFKIEDIRWNVFGSKNSNDCDVMAFLNKEWFPDRKLLPDESSKLSHCICAKLSTVIETKKVINVNLGILSDEGVLIWVYKGTPDESGNSIFYTYEFHKQLQKYECLIKIPVKRNVQIKVIRALRMILSMISQTDVREIVKKALKENTVECRLKTLRKINFEAIIHNQKKKENIIQIHKTIAFQIGQTLALIEGKEIYSKMDVAELYPDLAIFVNREKYEQSHLIALTNMLNILLTIIEEKIITENPEFLLVKEILLVE